MITTTTIISDIIQADGKRSVTIDATDHTNRRHRVVITCGVDVDITAMIAFKIADLDQSLKDEEKQAVIAGLKSGQELDANALEFVTVADIKDVIIPEQQALIDAGRQQVVDQVAYYDAMQLLINKIKNELGVI